MKTSIGYVRGSKTKQTSPLKLFSCSSSSALGATGSYYVLLLLLNVLLLLLLLLLSLVNIGDELQGDSSGED